MVDTSKHEPLDGSAGISTISGRVGTAGCFVRAGTAKCLLGSAHVMANNADTRVFQPPAASLSGALIVAELWDSYGPANSGESVNVLDAAIAIVSDGVEIVPSIGSLGRPRGFRTHLVENQRVSIHGAGGRRRMSGLVRELNDTPTVSYDDGGHAAFARLAKCDRYSVRGDSGAAVLDDEGFVVGVHLGGAGPFSWFCPISAVLARWPSLELIT